MSPQPTLYRIQPGPGAGQLSVTPVWQQSDLQFFAPGYRHLVPISLQGALYVLAVEDGGDANTAFRLESDERVFSPTDSNINLGQDWDAVEPFVIGNKQHLLAYSAKDGHFAFFPVRDDLSVEAPYRYYRAHEPAVTAGFSVVAPLTIQGALYYLGYSFDTGKVNIYSLAVTATSAPGTPPLASNYVWAHLWARKWTRFAFFQLGGENYFLKTNVGKLNVNIDHILDDPSQGTVEVGTQLDLPNALELDIVRSFYLGHGDPYFLTYMKADGTTTFNRFWGNCQGWTTEASLPTITDATQIVPLQFGDQCYVLFY